MRMLHRVYNHVGHVLTVSRRCIVGGCHCQAAHGPVDMPYDVGALRPSPKASGNRSPPLRPDVVALNIIGIAQRRHLWQRIIHGPRQLDLHQVQNVVEQRGCGRVCDVRQVPIEADARRVEGVERALADGVGWHYALLLSCVPRGPSSRWRMRKTMPRSRNTTGSQQVKRYSKLRPCPTARMSLPTWMLWEPSTSARSR